jgi:hypothetical protein
VGDLLEDLKGMLQRSLGEDLSSTRPTRSCHSALRARFRREPDLRRALWPAAMKQCRKTGRLYGSSNQQSISAQKILANREPPIPGTDPIGLPLLRPSI